MRTIALVVLLVVVGALLFARRARAPARCCDGPRDTVTTSGAATMPHLSPDGREIAYRDVVCAANGTRCHAALIVRALPGGPAVVVDSNLAPSQLAWTADGLSLLYVVNAGIFRVPAAGGMAERLDGAGIIALNRAGDSLAILRNREQHDTVTVTIRALGGASASDSLRLPWSDPHVAGLAWSPNGRWLAISEARGGTADAVYLVSRRGDIVDSALLKAHPYVEWSAAGDALYLFAWRGGASDAFVRLGVSAGSGHLAGTADTLFAAATGLSAGFDIARDEHTLAHVIGTRTDSIWGVDLNGAVGTAHLVLASAAWQYGAQLSPDGRTIAFVAADRSGDNVYTIPFVGGSATPLTTGDSQHSPFAWYPDGTQGVSFVLDNLPVPYTIDYPSGRAARIMAGSAVATLAAYTLTDSGGAYEIAPGRFLWLGRSGAKRTELIAPANWSVALALHDGGDALLTARDSATGAPVFARMTPAGRITPVRLLVDSTIRGAALLRWHGDTLDWARSFRDTGAGAPRAAVWRSDGRRVARIAELPPGCATAIVTMSADGRRLTCEKASTRTDIVLLHDFRPDRR